MLPKKIEICPIIDSVVEIRFKSIIFPDAVFGLIYDNLKADYPIVEKLPILDLPEKIRSSEPNLKYKPHYKANDGRYSIQIGPDVFVIGSVVPYSGWDDFSHRIFNSIESILKLGIIKEIDRLGLRYINFFEGDIFKGKVDIQLKISDLKNESTNTVIRTELKEGGFTNTLQIANNITQSQSGRAVIGSIIDIDTYKHYGPEEFIRNFKDQINLAHEVEKKLFFSILDKNFLKELKPSF
jgi:uncharacterized protein (TIGR04255 family)